jgi:hypothetical protein
MPVEYLRIPVGGIHLFPIPSGYHREVDRAESLLDLRRRSGDRTRVSDVRGEGEHLFASNVQQVLLPSPRDRGGRAAKYEFTRDSGANTTRSTDDPGDLAVQFHG